MQKIIRIARLELSILFYSPIAWLLLLIFMVQCGITYTEMLYNQETSQQLGRQLSVLTRVVFAGEYGLLSTAAGNLYLYIPLLSMGLLSREMGSGSIRLLQSSPVTNLQVVLGKFGAMVLYSLLLCTVLAMYMLAAYFSIESLDVSFVLGGIFGLFMLCCAYSAIGLFMSSLTSYQVVAAISTLAVLAAFNFIGGLGQGVPVLRDITYWLAISGKVETIVNGLLTSREILYFLSFTVFFLLLSNLKLNAGRKHRLLVVRLITYILPMLALIGVIYVSARPGFIAYADTTRVKDQTLSPKAQALIKKLHKPVRLISYTNLLHPTVAYGEPGNRMRDMRAFERYQRFLPDLRMEYVTYYDSVSYGLDSAKTLEEQAHNIAKVRGFDWGDVLPPIRIHKLINLQPEENRFVRMLEYEGKKIPLRMFDDISQYPGEPEVMAAFSRLTRLPARVWILAGNGERSTQTDENSSFSVLTRGVAVRASLMNQGFDTYDIKLAAQKEIPLDIAVLIIADPLKAYTPEDLGKIQAYIAQGGNVLLAGEPGKQGFVNPIAAKLGVRFEEGTVLQENKDGQPDVVEALFAPQADRLGFGFFPGAQISMPGVASIGITDTSLFKRTPLLLSDAAISWNKLGSFDLANETVKFDSGKDKKGQYLLMLALERKVAGRDQRIIVSGDADFMSNYELVARYGVQNASFAIPQMFKWFTNGRYPFSPDRSRATDTAITVSRAQINGQKVLFLIMPLLAGLTAGLILIRRNRK